MSSAAGVNRMRGPRPRKAHDTDLALTRSFAVARPLAESHDDRTLTTPCAGDAFQAVAHNAVYSLDARCGEGFRELICDDLHDLLLRSEGGRILRHPLYQGR